MRVLLGPPALDDAGGFAVGIRLLQAVVEAAGGEAQGRENEEDDFHSA